MILLRANLIGGPRNLTLETLWRLATALETSVSEIIVAADLPSKSQPAQFVTLLVEDNPADVYLVKKALVRCSIPIDVVVVVEDGCEAMDYLRRNSPYETADTPDLILLDLNLPKKNGYEVLQEVKSDDQLKRLPVVILTASSSKQDILKTYELHANSLVTKPVDADSFQKAVQKIAEYWLDFTNLPCPNKSW